MAAQRQKIEFTNQAGEVLAGALELPSEKPKAFALFAHCFSCSKDIAAASRIARRLAERGFGVLRFDFTGLGHSEGDFANTNFSSNVDDLVSAADYLREHYEAPTLLVGHSLGGAAVLAAAPRIEESKAVVTIGAPSSPDHVIDQFHAHREQIEVHGEAEVSLAGRPFKIKKQFLDDLNTHSLDATISKLKRALLVMHAPGDATVSIDEAKSIFEKAKHPKSFISLDTADHLLTRKADAEYVAEQIAIWAARYLPQAHEGEATQVRPAKGHVRVHEENHKFLRRIETDDHTLYADEPLKVGGDNLGPDPYEFLLTSLGTCTSMTIRMYANHKKWPLEDLIVDLSHRRDHCADSADCPDTDKLLDIIEREITLVGDLDEGQRARLLEIADRCPVHRTLENDIVVKTVLV